MDSQILIEFLECFQFQPGTIPCDVVKQNEQKKFSCRFVLERSCEIESIDTITIQTEVVLIEI
jgi:hypothetical protein